MNVKDEYCKIMILLKFNYKLVTTISYQVNEYETLL